MKEKTKIIDEKFDRIINKMTKEELIEFKKDLIKTTTRVASDKFVCGGTYDPIIPMTLNSKR